MVVTADPVYGPGLGGGSIPDPSYQNSGSFDTIQEVTEFVRQANDIAEAMLPNSEAVYREGAGGDSERTTAALFNGLSGMEKHDASDVFKRIDLANRAFVTPDSSLHLHDGYYDTFNHKEAELKMAMAFAWRGPGVGHSDNPEFDFYGFVFMPAAALYYYLFSDGRDRRVRIESLNMNMVVSDFKPIQELLDSNPSPGTYHVESDFSYNTLDKVPIDSPVGLTLGRVAGHVRGDLIVDSDGYYNFEGTYIIKPDIYNADLGTGRTFVQEKLTGLLSALGEMFGKNPYTLHVVGEENISFYGPVR
tara:strand:- start:1972 stop:2883 length:912 start_codon:yes stop_codon:yes gene_type:complete